MHRFLFLAVSAGLVFAQAQQSISGPDIRTYKTVGTTRLTAHLFRPVAAKPTELFAAPARGARPAIVLFHGGGWVAGSPEWVYDAAKRYASYGAVAVAAEYRLSDQKNITPTDALSDARDLIRWMRRNAASLGIDPNRIAVHGVSAGGHLAALLATNDDPAGNPPSAVPNAMVLISPAVAVAGDGWFRKILLNRASPNDLSPDERVDKALSPTAIFIGAADTLTPLRGVQRYCDRINQHGGECEIHVYPGVGHLFTRRLDDQEDDFDPDPKVSQDARLKGDRFLASKGFLDLGSGK